VTVIAPPRFEITEITAAIAGVQPFTLDAHVTTRGNKVNDVVSVTLGGLVIYCHDAASVRAFADTWASVLQAATPVLPEVANYLGGPGLDRNHIGMILRVHGAPTRKPTINVIPTGASPTGIPHARVGMGRLTVAAFDLTAIRSWTDGWATAEHTADRFWPTPDTFDAAEDTGRARIARTGTPAGTGKARKR
jgi:hypothetical protein